MGGKRDWDREEESESEGTEERCIERYGNWGQGEKVNRDQREWGELGNAERSNDGDI